MLSFFVNQGLNWVATYIMEVIMREKILQVLIEHSETYITGEQIAESLGVSRQSIWKHITALKTEGYAIESEKRKGYKLELDGTLNKTSVAMLSHFSTLVDSGTFYDTIDSTNSFLKREQQNLVDYLVVADTQHKGRGRLGRTWSSAKGEGLWFSLLLKPSLTPDCALMLTQVAALSIHRALLDATGLNTQIKWPNDIMYKDKKVCGILTEIASELGRLQYVIIGIGVNVNQEVFEEEISEIATSCLMSLGKPQSRLGILSSFLAHFESLYHQFIRKPNLSFISKGLNAISSIIDEPIWIISGDSKLAGIAKQIDDNGALIVELADGTTKQLVYGEVSIRKKE